MNEQLEKHHNILEIIVRVKRIHPVDIRSEITHAQETETIIVAETPEMAGKQVEQIAKDFLNLK